MKKYALPLALAAVVTLQACNQQSGDSAAPAPSAPAAAQLDTTEQRLSYGIAYTLGQRKGLGIAAGEPRYVTGIDASANIVTIGPEEDLFCDTVEVSEVRWTDTPLTAGRELQAKARYKADPAPATVVSVAGDTTTIRFDRRQRALTPGQALALYDDDQVLGGGTIERAWRSENPA